MTLSRHNQRLNTAALKPAVDTIETDQQVPITPKQHFDNPV